DFLGQGVAVLEARGVDNDPYPVTPDPWAFSPTEARDAEGLLGEYFESADLGGQPFRTAAERAFVRWTAPQMAAATRITAGSFRWSGWFWPDETGLHEFGLRCTGEAVLTVDGVALVTPDTEARPDHIDVIGQMVPRRLAGIELTAGRGYRVQIDYTPKPRGYEYLGLGIRPPVEPMARAIEAAREADAVVLVLGSGVVTEAEGYDRLDMALPGGQNELARQVLAANPNTVVVMNGGSPFELPWIDDARAVMQMWLPGETGPDALAAVIFGDRDPGGRLPLTYPVAFGDHPAHAVGPDPAVCDYAEGLAMGYRGFDQSGVRPLFPFGHGLAYTTFDIRDLDLPASAGAGAPVALAVTVENTGDRAGWEVVQAYVGQLDPRLPRPPKELKAFAKIRLEPGETRRVTLTLEPRAFAPYDPATKSWPIDPGDYDILVGRSAGDIRVKGTVRLA
ncbi:MAG: glycoside hydrolase family 3 C-terminal domain-containing protein, partial [Phenylobacterium sp.]|nr:glycoside hydrolase family 3 C-terminal domain-containing protein [Phenylobacterium sp.]